ncbi:HAD-IIA family hydrolase [Nocardioides sp.]|uniref:HAD-IIA family hydrolase n=1 Tax=Nocardioides sp. TaxID=35761 RepID=UPI0026016A4E|nr:HAD-IIA family hydrolase [Nocardioides sp.]
MESTAGRALINRYDVVMLDLDGVVYIGGAAVPGAPEYLAQARGAGARLAFVTNNAARRPETVSDHLVELGVPATPADVVTSAQAAARVLADRLPAGSRIATLGSDGLLAALEAVGLVPVAVDDVSAVAIVNGYAPEVTWRQIMRAAVRIKEGLWWVATNTDLTIPTAFGTAPGNGVMVELLQGFSGVTPVVAGKPDRPLLDETIRRVGGERPLMVGDRLDTDIAGGAHAGVDTLLVMTGVTGVADLAAARGEERPTYVAADLGGLVREPSEVVSAADEVTCGGWRVTIQAGALKVEGEGAVDDWWRAVAAAAWQVADSTGTVANVDALTPPTGR